ncbi:MAG: hypothetical protein NVSMB6_01080 [Burkholderiaceae bacterium]
MQTNIRPDRGMQIYRCHIGYGPVINADTARTRLTIDTNPYIGRAKRCLGADRHMYR